MRFFYRNFNVTPSTGKALILRLNLIELPFYCDNLNLFEINWHFYLTKKVYSTYQLLSFNDKLLMI